jgi:hypothetical protein
MDKQSEWGHVPCERASSARLGEIRDEVDYRASRNEREARPIGSALPSRSMEEVRAEEVSIISAIPSPLSLKSLQRRSNDRQFQGSIGRAGRLD